MRKFPLSVLACVAVSIVLLLGTTSIVHAQWDRCDELARNCPRNPGSHSDGVVVEWWEAGPWDSGDSGPVPLFKKSPGGEAGIKIAQEQRRELKKFLRELAPNVDVPVDDTEDWVEQSSLDTADGTLGELREQAYETTNKSGWLKPWAFKEPKGLPTSQGRPFPTTELGETLRNRHASSQTEPVNPANGEYYIDSVDLSFPSFGISYAFVRRYHSRINFNGPLGNGWDISYNRHLVYLEESQPDFSSIAYEAESSASGDEGGIDSTTGLFELPTATNPQSTAELGEEAEVCGQKIALSTGDGATIVFREIGVEGETTFYKSGVPRLNLSGQTVDGELTWKLFFKEGGYEQYDANGFMVSKVDVNGVGLSLSWKKSAVTGGCPLGQDSWRLS